MFWHRQAACKAAVINLFSLGQELATPMLGQSSGLLCSLFLLCLLHIIRVSSHHHVLLCPDHSVTWLGAHRLHTHLLGLFAVYGQIITRLSGSFRLLGSVLEHWLGLFAVYVQIMMWLSGSFSCLAQCLHIGLAYLQCMFRSWCGRCTFLTEDKQRWHSLSLDLLCTFCSKCLFLCTTHALAPCMCLAFKHDSQIGPHCMWASSWTRSKHSSMLVHLLYMFIKQTGRKIIRLTTHFEWAVYADMTGLFTCTLAHVNSGLPRQ
jgi:hypothetical protein